MFSKRRTDLESFATDYNIKTENYEKSVNVVKDISRNIGNKPLDEKIDNGKVNHILRGSRLKGDINITCDLELSGDVEGNIISQDNANIVIKGICKGNIETREGNVNIEGELQSGNIIAGSNVTISGKFNGGEIKAKGKIYVDGEFNGKLVGNEIEIGANARGKGELFYGDSISISRGARIEGQIIQTQKDSNDSIVELDDFRK